MTYDDRGRVETQVSFEGVVTRFVYDDTAVGGGRLSQQRFYPSLSAYQTTPTSPAETWSFGYDAFGREVSVTVTGAQPRRVTSRYDDLGQLILMNTPEGAIEYQYDAYSRKTATRVGKTIANGQPLSSFTAERATEYAYDSLSRLSKVTEVVYATSGQQRDEHRYFYDLLGSLDAELASNGLYQDYVYDNMQRLRQLTHYRTDGTLADIADLSDDPRIVRFDYTVRSDGRRTAANESWYEVGSATQSAPLQASYQFTYDDLGRLTDEVFDHWDNSLDYRDRFAYDPAGNRVEKSRDAGRDGSIDARTAYHFDVNDRLVDELAYGRPSAPESRTTYTYDHTQNTGYRSERFVSGSQTRTTLTHVYTYDLQGRLFTATVTNYNDAGAASSITRSTYDYDHTGIRVSALNEIDSNADGTFETRTKIEYLVDHSNHTGYQQVIRESHFDVATGKLIKVVDYTFGHDEISQTVVTYNSTGAEASRTKQWFLHDGKANVRGLLGTAAAMLTITGIEQIYFYDAYGSLLNLQASQAATTLLYNGEMFDALTGNQYLRARYYNPANAQFNRLDPFFGNHQDPQSFNKYAYVHGDPVWGADPSGLSLLGGFGAFAVNVGMRVNSFMAQNAAIKSAVFAASISTISSSLAKEAGGIDIFVSGVIGGVIGAGFGVMASYSQTAAALTGAALMVFMSPYIYANVKKDWNKGNYAKAVFDTLTVMVAAPFLFTSLAASAVTAVRGSSSSIAVYTRSAALMAWARLTRNTGLFYNNKGALPPVAAGAYDTIAGQSAGGLSGQSVGATPTGWHPKVQTALAEAYNIWVASGRKGNEPGNCAEWRAINELALKLGDQFSFGQHVKVQAIGTGVWNEKYPLLESVKACDNCYKFLSSLVDLLPGGIQ